MPYKIERVLAPNATDDMVRTLLDPDFVVYEVFEEVQRGLFTKRLEWKYVAYGVTLAEAELEVLKLQGQSPKQLARRAAKLVPREVVKTYD